MTENRTTLISAADKKIVKFWMGVARGETTNTEVSLVFSKFPDDSHVASNYITSMADYVRGYVHREFDSWANRHSEISDGEVNDFVLALGDRLEHTFNLPDGCWKFDTMLFNGSPLDSGKVNEMLEGRLLFAA